MLEALLHEIAAPYAQPGAPGASIAVLRLGAIVASRACGLADVEGGIPATLATNYRLASLSKAFTAMAIMLLAEAGKLRFDDRARDLLPAFPAYGSAIRVRHLLNHTSGLWDYEDFVQADQPNQVLDQDVPGLLARADRLYFAPGTAYRYSNSGYVLIGLIVAAISGKPFAHFLHENIFAPLGMDGTRAYQPDDPNIPRRAWGYTVAEQTVTRSDQSPTSATLGDGGIYSSITDLARWDRALMGHALIQPATWQQAITPPLLPDGRRAPYGFGWFVAADRHGRRVWHHGETSGFTNGMVRYLEQELTVIMLTNRGDGQPWQRARQLAETVL